MEKAVDQSSLRGIQVNPNADGDSRILNMTVGMEAAQRVYDEALAKLNTGEVVRVVDAKGQIVLSSE